MRGFGESEPAADALVSAVKAANNLEWSAMDGPAAMASVAELETARRGIETALATGMEHLDRTGATETIGGLATHNWLAHATHGSAGTAKASMQLGRILQRFPGFADAIRSGTLSPEHGLALHAVSNPRIADLLVEAETTLLDMARDVTFAAFRRNLRVIARHLDTDGPEPDCSDHDQMSLSTDGQGDLHLRGRFSGHHAVSLEHALRHEYDRQYRAAVNEHRHGGAPIPAPATLRARALIEIVRRGLTHNPATTTKAKVEAIIIIDGDTATTINGEPLDPTTAAVLTCDAWCHPIIIDPTTGTPLFAGRGTRYATPDQRRALIARDGGCVFPGCDTPASWCDAHHIIPWEHGGTTDLDTLALLCRRHHGYAHSNNWTLQAIPQELNANGQPAPPGAIRLIWHTPNGTINAQQASDRRRPPPPPTATPPPRQRRTAA